jgi:hypothetical protein
MGHTCIQSQTTALLKFPYSIFTHGKVHKIRTLVYWNLFNLLFTLGLIHVQSVEHKDTGCWSIFILYATEWTIMRYGVILQNQDK